MAPTRWSSFAASRVKRLATTTPTANVNTNAVQPDGRGWAPKRMLTIGILSVYDQASGEQLLVPLSSSQSLSNQRRSLP